MNIELLRSDALPKSGLMPAERGVLALPPAWAAQWTDAKLWFQAVARRPVDDRVVFCINNRSPEPVAEHYPEATDSSFEGYASRMTGLLGPQDYCLILNRMRRDLPILWHELESLLLEFHGVVLPDHADMGIFIGAYQRSPFGIHQDPGRVFILPIVGTKKLRFWPQAYMDAVPSLRRKMAYAEHLGGSVLHAFEPGQLLFIPEDHWHIAESDGEFAVSVSVYDVE